MGENMKFILLTLSLVLITGCTQKGTYEAIQHGQKTDCQPLFGDEYDRCMEKYAMPYDEYKREREKAMQKDQDDHS